MSTFAQELRQHVIEPTVWQMGLGAPGVINLLVGTALTESGLKSLKQRRGPALGLWQMEPDTHEDIWENYLAYREDLAATLWAVTGIAAADAETMVYNLRYACAMARVHYKRVSEPIPTTVEGQARYWKQWYNTPKGRGTVKHYLKEVEGILV